LRADLTSLARGRPFRDSPIPPAWSMREASVLLRHCSGVASVLFPCTTLVRPLYDPCTTLVRPLYDPCTTLVLPLYNPYTCLVPLLAFQCAPDGNSVAPRNLRRAPFSWSHWFRRYSNDLVRGAEVDHPPSLGDAGDDRTGEMTRTPNPRFSRCRTPKPPGWARTVKTRRWTAASRFNMIGPL
jgi:hypothetical protein